MTMLTKELLYEGKAKRVYAHENGLCVIEYKDTATAFNGEKKEEFRQKGELNCAICAEIFDYLASNGIPTHYVRRLSDVCMLVKHVEIVPLEAIVRNITAGSFSKKYGVAEGITLNAPCFEYSYKNDELGDPMINDSQILALGLASRGELDRISQLCAAVNTLLVGFFAKAGLRLVDFKLEFGRSGGEIVLADEISPDTCRLWDAETSQKLDKDRFRRDLGGVTEAYREVYRRICAAREGKDGN